VAASALIAPCPPVTQTPAMPDVAGRRNMPPFSREELNAVGLRSLTPAQRERPALILGAEGPGLSAATMAAADARVTIPMRNGVDSLNVAAAAAVAFWELCR